MAYGTACASFNVEGFGSERLYELDRAEIDARVAELEEMTFTSLSGSGREEGAPAAPARAPAPSTTTAPPREARGGGSTAAPSGRGEGHRAGVGMGVRRGDWEVVVGCVEHEHILST